MTSNWRHNFRPRFLAPFNGSTQNPHNGLLVQVNQEALWQVWRRRKTLRRGLKCSSQCKCRSKQFAPIQTNYFRLHNYVNVYQPLHVLRLHILRQYIFVWLLRYEHSWLKGAFALPGQDERRIAGRPQVVVVEEVGDVLYGVCQARLAQHPGATFLTLCLQPKVTRDVTIKLLAIYMYSVYAFGGLSHRSWISCNKTLKWKNRHVERYIAEGAMLCE